MTRAIATDLVTGAFSYSGAQIAKRLLEAGRRCIRARQSCTSHRS